MSTPETRQDHLRTGFDVGAVVAGDTIEPLAERITKMLSHDRRLVKIHRYAHGQTMKTDPGLRPDPGREDAISLKAQRYPEGLRQFWVDLSPGIHGFGFSATDSSLERRLRPTYERHHKRWIEGSTGDSIYDQPVTYVHVTGRGTEAGRDDRIEIESWNEHGVGQLTTIVFQCDWDY